ncbi:hypothetical protein PJJ87_28870, partial [Mycobacterium kansasii]
NTRMPGPGLIVLAGLPGTGKSAVAATLAKRLRTGTSTNTASNKYVEDNRLEREMPDHTANSGIKIEITAAIVDRLTFAGQIIETGSASYRLAQARKTRPAGGANSNRHAGASSS